MPFRIRLAMALFATSISCSNDGLLIPFAPPTLTAIGTAEGVQGTTASIALTGTGFVPGAAAVVVSGTGVSVTGLSVTSATSATATISIAADATLGAHDVTVKTAGGTSEAKIFVVKPPVPTLTAISPAVGVRGTTARLTLSGTNFVSGGTTVSVSAAGVTAGAVSVASATSLTLDLAIAASAALGVRTVTVTTAGGTSGTQTFTVNPPVPTLTAIAPSIGVQGTTASVTLTGTTFVAGATTVNVGGTGVTASNVNVTSDSVLTLDLTVAAGAALGARIITVTTVGGTSGTQTFTVNPPVPTLTAIAPAVGVQGATVSVTLTGTSFVTGATTVNVGGTGVTAGNVNVTSGTSLTVDLAVAADAALGPRIITITTAGGTSGTQTFTVNPPVPTLTAIAPSAGVQGTSVSVTLTGTSFITGATTVNVDGTGVTASNVNVTSGTSLTVSLTVAAGAALGAHAVTVTTAGGTSGAQIFRVNPPVPTLAAIAPSAGVQGTSVSVTLTGTRFVGGATTVNVGGTGVTASNVNVVSGTSLTADLTIAAGAALSARPVSVTTPGGTSGTQTFTVNPPVPTLAGLSPNTGAQGGVRSVTLTGTDFVSGATTVNVSGAGVTISNVNVSSSTSLTADFTTMAGAALGTRNVSVTTSGGTSGTQTFDVVVGPSITDFTALATHLTLVQPVTIRWATANATTCTIMPTFLSVSCAGPSGIVTPGATQTYTLTASNAGASVQSAATVFVNEPGRRVYSSANQDNQLRMYSLNSTTGDLTPIGGGTVGLGAGNSAPADVTVDPSGRYAYATNTGSDNISMYMINATTGALTSNGTISAGNQARGIAVDPTARYAYVVNQNTPGTSTVSMYTINGSGQLVGNGTIAAGTQAVKIAIDALGRYVYAANFSSSNISMYSINTNGTLTSLGTLANGGGAYGVAADPSGRFIYTTTHANGGVNSYAIGSDGTLIAGNSVAGTGTMLSVAIDPTGRFVYAVDNNNAFIHTYAINQTTGNLTAVGGGVATGGSPSDVSVDPQGKFVYTANLTGTISIFSIDQTTGAVTLVNTVAAGNSARGIVVSR